MILGNGTFLNGDALALMRLYPAESVALIVTDPPYRVISGGDAPTEGFGWRNSVLSANDGKIFKHNDVNLAEMMREFYRILAPNAHCYVMINVLNLEELLTVARDAGFKLHNVLTWDKRTATANRWYMNDCEFTCFFYKGAARKINNCGSKRRFTADNPRKKLHPTEKPVELMRHYIENSSQEGELVLDPFAGSGSTAVAAQQSGRRWLSMEMDGTFYYATVARIVRECEL